MKFTIATASSSLGFEEDLKLIKSSLLYADEIELIGMAEYAIFKYLPMKINSVKDVDALADAFIPLFKSIKVDGSDEIIRQLEDLKIQITPFRGQLNKKKRRTGKEIIAQKRIEALMFQFREEFMNSVSSFTSSPSTTEIAKLIEKEIVSVLDYGYEDFDLDSLAGGYLGSLLGTIQNHTAYPLFDKTSNDVISSFAKTNILDLGNIDKEVLTHAGIATNILMTLPTLEEASVDEILDFKKDMSLPLANFRKAIYGFAESVTSCPWDENFLYDCLKLYNTQVLPKVEELNELSSETSVLKNFGRKVLADEEIRKNAKYLTGGLVTTITTSSNMIGALDSFTNWMLGLSMIFVAPNAVSMFLKTLNMASEAKQEIKPIKREVTGNTMYYYYKASKDL